MTRPFFHILPSLFHFLAFYTYARSRELIHLLPELLNNLELINSTEKQLIQQRGDVHLEIK